ncbi:MAG: hypothetical protein JNK82_00690 [Myxococcaceae bacterium]|nr:hypothetical protein [Myxococcaceae bacterium]
MNATELLTALRNDAKHFGPELARSAYEKGLAVTKREDGTTKPIPITATPVIVNDAELAERLKLSALLSSAGAKMAHALMKGSKRALLLDAMSPLEQRLALATYERALMLVTTRVDFFVGARASALELNATIPAMQGYSEIAAHTLLDIVGRRWGLDAAGVARLQAQNGSNARALYDALLQGYAKVRPGKTPRTIALLCRRNDAQLTEQRYLCSRFRAFGADADVVHPDELSGDDAVRANGKAYELVYRHLFVRRLEEPDMKGADYVVKLLEEPQGKRAVVLNPPASQVEAKLVFALMSQALEDAAIGTDADLTKAELDAIAQSVPWTRPFHDDTMLKKVSADPDRYVLKRSWDYGGRAVFVGRTRNEPSYAERVKAAYGAELDWQALCQRALNDRAGGGFIVQEIVETQPEPHLLCSGDTQSEAQLYVDFSSYASVGLAERSGATVGGPRSGGELDAAPAWGGVCRGSISHIVNIVGGGGVIPLLSETVARDLTNVYRVHSKHL